MCFYVLCAWVLGIGLMLVQAAVEDSTDFFNKALVWSPSPYWEAESPTLPELQCKQKTWIKDSPDFNLCILYGASPPTPSV
jgi:hypothetical protein